MVIPYIKNISYTPKSKYPAGIENFQTNNSFHKDSLQAIVFNGDVCAYGGAFRAWHGPTRIETSLAVSPREHMRNEEERTKVAVSETAGVLNTAEWDEGLGVGASRDPSTGLGLHPPKTNPALSETLNAIVR